MLKAIYEMTKSARREEEKQQPMKKATARQRSSAHPSLPSTTGSKCEGNGGRRFPNRARMKNTKSRPIINLNRRKATHKKRKSATSR